MRTGNEIATMEHPSRAVNTVHDGQLHGSNKRAKTSNCNNTSNSLQSASGSPEHEERSLTPSEVAPDQCGKFSRGEGHTLNMSRSGTDAHGMDESKRSAGIEYRMRHFRRSLCLLAAKRPADAVSELAPLVNKDDDNRTSSSPAASQPDDLESIALDVLIFATFGFGLRALRKFGDSERAFRRAQVLSLRALLVQKYKY